LLPAFSSPLLALALLTLTLLALAGVGLLVLAALAAFVIRGIATLLLARVARFVVGIAHLLLIGHPVLLLCNRVSPIQCGAARLTCIKKRRAENRLPERPVRNAQGRFRQLDNSLIDIAMHDTPVWPMCGKDQAQYL
jgi:hypothetical protein